MHLGLEEGIVEFKSPINQITPTDRFNLLGSQSHVVQLVAVFQALFHIEKIRENIRPINKCLQCLIELGVDCAIELDWFPGGSLCVFALPADLAEFLVDLKGDN